MLKWTSLKKNKYFKIFLFINISAILLGVFFYFKFRININIDEINLTTLIKNHSIYHILFVTFIFFLSFLFLGAIFGIISYSFELISLIILGITLFNNWTIKGLILFIILLGFKILYFLLLIYLITRSLKITQNLITKQNYSKDKILIYIKEAIYTSLIVIAIEIFNYFIGYKVITFFTKLLQIMI